MKHLSIILILLSSTFVSFGQISIGGQPLSSKAEYLRTQDIQTVNLAPPSRTLIDQQDVESELQGLPPRYAVLLPVNLDMSNSGTWTDLKGGSRIWRLRLETTDAIATMLLYDQFSLPEGAVVYIYNDDRSSMIGGFTSQNNQDGGNYATQLVYGNACTIEYYEPSSVQGQAVISIASLGHAYRYVNPPNDDRAADPCEVDINCSEGNNWQDQKHGVVRMSIVTNNSAGWCTASLVNNTSLNCASYILSAMHCTENSNASNFGQYTFYFNYESTGCGSGSASTGQSLVGCNLRADSQDGGGNSGSDFALMEATSSIPSSYTPYYNGWNAQNVASGSGVGIHHPAGDRKKISTYTSTLTTTGWGVSNTHWQVYWAGTANGHGVTEGGSSGSPLFNSSGLIIGTLTGGGSYCSQVPNPSPDSYGKMSYHWQSDPGDHLKDWLDPGNTGQTALTGTYAPCAPSTTYDAGISDVVQPAGSVCSNSITPVLTLTNYGSTTLTSVTITYNIDGSGAQTYNWTGSLAANQSTNVTLSPMTVTAGNHTFNASTSNPNNQTDDNGSNDASASAFSIVISDTYVTLVLNTDDYGSETTWDLALNGGGTVASGGPYTEGQHIQDVQQLCVQSGSCYTFTIHDAANDGICCYTGSQNPNYQDGNYSLGDNNGIDIWTGSEFTSSETVDFCVPTSGGSCDTLYDPFVSNASGFVIYSNSGGGYVAGANSFGDLAKAQEFDPPQQTVEVSGLIFWIAAKADAGAAVAAKLYSLDGAGTDLGGATNSAPGTVLASASMNLSRIDTSGFFNHIEFSSPVAVSAGYAVGLDFSGFGANDQIGIVTNTDGDANGADQAWEQWSDNAWHSMNEAWSSQLQADFDLGIFPVLCPQIVTGMTDLDNVFNIYPNPGKGKFFLINSAGLDGQLRVFNALGQEIANQNLDGNTTVGIDLMNKDAGVYLVQVTTDQGVWNGRLVVTGR